MSYSSFAFGTNNDSKNFIKKKKTIVRTKISDLLFISKLQKKNNRCKISQKKLSRRRYFRNRRIFLSQPVKK